LIQSKKTSKSSAKESESVEQIEESLKKMGINPSDSLLLAQCFFLLELEDGD
jgi:hypothetical protein